MAEMYDITIIGGGAAGFTAGIYAARDRCRALLLERVAAGGQVQNCEHIENYPGFPDGVAGYTLGPLLQQQAMQLGLGVRGIHLKRDTLGLQCLSTTARFRCRGRGKASIGENTVSKRSGNDRPKNRDAGVVPSAARQSKLGKTAHTLYRCLGNPR